MSLRKILCARSIMVAACCVSMLTFSCENPDASAQRSVRPPRPSHPPPLRPLSSPTAMLLLDAGEADATPARAAPPVPTAPPTILSRGTWRSAGRGLRVHRSVVRLADGTEGPWITLRVSVPEVRFGATRTADDRLASALRAPALASIVAGYFERDKTPSGVLESNGTVHGQHHAHAGSGLLLVREQRASVLPASTPNSEWGGAELVVQCGPRLVEAGPTVGVLSDRGDRYARAAACVRDGGRTVDFVVTWSSAEPLRGPGLLAFALALAGPSPAGDTNGCEVALNLDGGPSAGLHINGPSEGSHAPVGPVPWAIVLSAR